MIKEEFPKNFLWGASTSDIQIEGASGLYGKGETIWDRYCKQPGRILNNQNPEMACDHYHLYREDVKVMKEIGLKAYRLSISWARVFPDGKNTWNKQGIDFYKKLIDLLLENDIKPVVTLHHWGFPQKLQDIGGWVNRDVTDYFQEYVQFVFKNLGDKVETWITHNEPIGTSYLGFFKGSVAPGIQDFYSSILVTHHLLLSHAKAVETYRQFGYKGEIGITLNAHPAIPVSEKSEDKDAAHLMDLYFNRWFQDALFCGSFPNELIEFFSQKGIEIPEMSADDFKQIMTPIDFLGVNYYYPHYVKHNPLAWPFEADFSPSSQNNPHTYTGWDIYPEGLYQSIRDIYKHYGRKKIYITENGLSLNDYPNEKQKIMDLQRIDFHSRHIAQIKRCLSENMDIKGYFIWSLMDNFEWTYGYSQRFGITYVDFKTQRRKMKESAEWYSNVIRNNGSYI